jgi:hypothetical protein
LLDLELQTWSAATSEFDGILKAFETEARLNARLRSDLDGCRKILKENCMTTEGARAVELVLEVKTAFYVM